MEVHAAPRVIDCDGGKNILMPAVESVCDTEHGRKCAHNTLIAVGKPRETFMLAFRMAFPVIARHVGDDFDFAVGEPEQFAVPYEIVAVLVML